MKTVADPPEAKPRYVPRRFVGGSRDGESIAALPRRYEVTVVARSEPFAVEMYHLRSYVLRTPTYDATWQVFRLDGMDDIEVRRRLFDTISPTLHWDV